MKENSGPKSGNERHEGVSGMQDWSMERWRETERKSQFINWTRSLGKSSLAQRTENTTSQTFWRLRGLQKCDTDSEMMIVRLLTMLKLKLKLYQRSRAKETIFIDPVLINRTSSRIVWQAARLEQQDFIKIQHRFRGLISDYLQR